MSSEKCTPSSPSDEEGLQVQELGTTEELRRDFSIWSLGSLCLCLMGTWEALTSVVAAALTNGGAPCLFYNYIITFLGTIAIACSLAEIASIWPTAGGLISIGGQIVLTASAAFAAGLQFQALITLNHPDSYVPARWQGMLFYWLVLVYSAAVNIWGSKALPHTNLASGILHVVGFVAIMVVMGIMAPKHTAHFVFVEFSNTSGWTSDGVSWLVGLLSTVYPFLGYDAACHLAEEMPRPARNVPLAMVGSVLMNGIMGLGFAIMLLFSLGDLNDLLTSPLGFPYMQLFLNITQNKAGATMLVLIVSLVAVAANAAGCTSTSRTFWAFARDDAVPCSKLFSRVNPTLKVPVPAIVAVTVVQMLLGLLYLGNSTAFNAVLSMAILGMYASYILPIVYMLVYGRGKLDKEEFGPFSLGRAGLVINAVAVGWLVVAMVFSTFPSVEPATPQNMNYAIVVMGGWLAIGTVYFFGWGRKKYAGPTV
ncbi:amino acid transporter-like protein [Stipitochalara longipes BDJ]|nr:amino acid transporter-like protein [Stipitochalara longipes BDJ]